MSAAGRFLCHARSLLDCALLQSPTYPPHRVLHHPDAEHRIIFGRMMYVVLYV